MNSQDYDALVKLGTKAGLLGQVPVIDLYIKRVSANVLSMREISEMKAQDQDQMKNNFSRYSRRPIASEVEPYLTDLDRFYHLYYKSESFDEIVAIKKKMIEEAGGEVKDYPNGITASCPFIVYDESKSNVKEPTEVKASLSKPPGMDLFRDSLSLPRHLHVHRGGYVFTINEWVDRVSKMFLDLYKGINNVSTAPGLNDRNFALAKEWEMQKFNDASLVTTGVGPESFSLVNPDIHRQLRENIVDKQVDAYIRGKHEKFKKQNPNLILDVQGKIGMKLGRATGATIYSRIKHGEWNVAATALTGLLGHNFINGNLGVPFVQKYHPWGQYYPLALEGQRFSASDIIQFNTTSRSGQPHYSHSLIWAAAKARMIGNVPKELQVATRVPAKWMSLSLQNTKTYATSKEVASANISSWEADQLFIFAFDLKTMDKGYTRNHNQFATSCYPYDAWREWLWVENGVDTLVSSNRGDDMFDVIATGHKIKPSGENDTSYGNSNVNLREYLKAIKYAHGYEYDQVCPEQILDTAFSRVMVSGDDLITAVESKDMVERMFEYFDKYSNWKVVYTEIPVFLSVFFAQGLTFNSIIRCVNNHFEGEHAKEHPLILTMSLGSHYKLLAQNPFYKVWIDVMNKFLSDYPLYCLCGSVEECGEFIDSDECKYLMIEYSVSGQKAADDIRDMLRGFIYSFTPDDSLTNRNFFLDLLFSLENNQPEMIIDVTKSQNYNKKLESLFIEAFENPFSNSFESGRKVIAAKLADMNLFTIDNKSKKLLDEVSKNLRDQSDQQDYYDD